MEYNLKSPKLIAADIDGTFLRPDRTYDRPRFERILKRMHAKGAKFVVASGNQIALLENLFPGFEGQISYVAENGALIRDEQEVIFAGNMDPYAIKRVLEVQRQHPEIKLVLCGVKSAYCQRGLTDPRFFDFINQFYGRLAWADDLQTIDDQVLKFALLVPEEQSLQYVDLFKQELGGLIEATDTGFGYIDLIVPGCHKASGLQKLAERWNIDPQDCAAFGDGGNDIEMLNYCGLSFAMANAKDSVKAAAQYVCKSDAEDGVLEVLDQLYPEESHI